MAMRPLIALWNRVRWLIWMLWTPIWADPAPQLQRRYCCICGVCSMLDWFTYLLPTWVYRFQTGEQYSRMGLTTVLYEVSFTLTDPVLRLWRRELRVWVALSEGVSYAWFPMEVVVVECDPQAFGLICYCKGWTLRWYWSFTGLLDRVSHLSEWNFISHFIPIQSALWGHIGEYPCHFQM